MQIKQTEKIIKQTKETEMDNSTKIEADIFMDYVRTLMFWRLRLKNETERTAVYIPYSKVLEFIPTNTKDILAQLVASGELEIIQRTSTNKKTYYCYKALKAGYITPHLLEPKGAPLTPLHSQMMQYLLHVELPDDSEATIFFKAFQLLKKDFLRLFFTVDTFCGRVHTPLTNLHRPLRKHLLFFGNPIASLDVAQMQPTILGKILFENIGANEFSTWLDEGKDIYIMLQSKANLETRDQGKKRFFEILFSKPNDSLAKMFGDANWITWINQMKSQHLKENPHSQKPHSNIAYLLQSTEVNIMQKVWARLAGANTPFISIHDEIIVQIHHLQQANKIFNSVLQVEFNHYKLNNKAGDNPPALHPEPLPKVEVFKTGRIGHPIKEQPQNWSNDIADLENYFASIELPTQPVKLNQCSTITDCSLFIESHFATVKRNNGNRTFLPYLNRLQELKQVLTKNSE